MKFYRMKNKHGVSVWKWSDKKHALVWVRELVANELYTVKEFEKILNGATLSGCGKNETLFDVVDIPKNNTYWMFGARFECRG